MTHCVMLLALLLAQGIPNQTVSPVGRSATSAVTVQGSPSGVPIPVDIGGTSVSATTTCHATTGAPTYVNGTDNPLSCDLGGLLRTNATSGGGGGASTPTVGANATYNANAVCATVLVDGQAGAGFFLAAGSLNATLATSLSQNATPAAPGCTGGNWSTTAFEAQNGSTSTNLVFGGSNGVIQLGIQLEPGVRCARVCTTSWASGSAVGFLTSNAVPRPPNGSNLSVGVAGFNVGSGTQVGGVDYTTGFIQYEGIQDADTGGGTHWVFENVLVKPASGGPVLFGTSTDPVRTDPTGTTTQPISAASLPLPAGAATDRTTAAGPFSVRISTGAAFIDPTQIRALTVSDAITATQGPGGASAWLVTGTGGTFPVTGTFWQATQPVSLAAAVDVSDRAARLLGVGYGSQGQQLKQTATNFNLQTETAVGGTLIDPRSIRALTVADVVGIGAGTAIIGKVGIDQTTPGTTNGVQVNAALPAGGNTIGGVNLTQYTPASGRLPVDGSGVTQPVSIAGTVPVTQGGAASVYSDYQPIYPMTATALPAHASKTVCFRNAANSPDVVYLGGSAVLNHLNGTPFAPGEGDCRSVANSNLLFFFSLNGGTVAFDGTN